MVSPENTIWLSDYRLIDGAFSDQNPTFPWHIDQIDGSASVRASFVIKESASRKRIKSESCVGSSSKACREKQRRDRLNDKYSRVQAHQLFQRDAQTITPEALENVKAAFANSETEYKAKTKKRAVPRKAARQSWEDPTLAEWPENDYRLLCGDLGNEVNMTFEEENT